MATIWIRSSRRDYFETESPADGLKDLEVALWDVGYAVWSEPAPDGALQHRGARVEPSVVLGLRDTLCASIDACDRREFLVPDSASEEIRTIAGGRERVLRSCHDLFEENSGLVALSYGIAPLEGRTREDALAKEPADFLAFRRTWSDAKQAIRAALPKDGELVDRAKLATLGLK